MSELPDFKKILFPDMPAIPLEEVVPDVPTEVTVHVDIVVVAYIVNASIYALQALNLLERCLVYCSKKRTTASNVSTNLIMRTSSTIYL